MSILKTVSTRLSPKDSEVMSLEDYLENAKKDSSLYATPHERLLKAIGQGTLVDTENDSRLARIWMRQKLVKYDVFNEFYGMDRVIESIVGFLEHGAQGLEERKQILYLLGPVGSSKSSAAATLSALVEKEPIYVLTAGDQMSPVFESPLGLFSKSDAKELGIPSSYLVHKLSGWAVKRLKEFDGDISKFTVTKITPSRLRKIAVSRVEPGDANNQDQTSIVGKSNISKVGTHAQTDPDSFLYSGGLCIANQGLLEFVEMFKAPRDLLNPLLTATQEGIYDPKEPIGLLPFQGIILAHSNESEWNSFRNNKENEALLDRIYIIKVPYVVQVSEEIKIYEKMLADSKLADKPRTKDVLRNLAMFVVLSRLKQPSPGDIFTKLKVYDGENMKEQDKSARTAEEYRKDAGPDEGMDGISTRTAFKLLSKTFNYSHDEIAADSVLLFSVINDFIVEENLPKETADRYTNFLTRYIMPEFKEELEKVFQRAYLDSHGEYGQNLFNRYVALASDWVDENDYRDPDTGSLWSKSQIDAELQKLERPAGIVNAKDFRNEVVRHVLKVRASGKTVDWRNIKVLADVIEKNMFTSMETLLPILSEAPKDSTEAKDKHDAFVKRMMERGYTEKQVVRLVKWFQQPR